MGKHKRVNHVKGIDAFTLRLDKDDGSGCAAGDVGCCWICGIKGSNIA
jgi:hypothetical protein